MFWKTPIKGQIWQADSDMTQELIPLLPTKVFAFAVEFGIDSLKPHVTVRGVLDCGRHVAYIPVPEL